MVAVEVGPKRPKKKGDAAERHIAKRPHTLVKQRRSSIVRLPTDGPLPPIQKRRFIGVEFDALSMGEALQHVIARAGQARPFSYVTTPNVDHRVRMEREPELRAVYDSAWLTLCDSRILELLSSLDHNRIESVPGADLVEELFRFHLDPDEPVNIIGESELVIESLKSHFGLTRVNWHNPPFGLRRNPEAIEAAADFVAAHPARFTFICVGSPQQEMVAAAITRRQGAVGVGLCCGASLGFLTGSVQRAPRWMRRWALEWLHRLVMEPTRMYRRYLIDGPAIFPIWLRYRGQSGQAVSAPALDCVVSNDSEPLLGRAAK